MKKTKLDYLKGVRVLLSAHYIPGPLAGLLLSNLGAEVIKVEPPFGDFMRGFPPFLKSKSGEKKMSAYFRALNSGLKSIAIDFKNPEEIDTFKKLIKNSDVLIDGNRANFLTKKVLKCEINEINPDIVHIPITSYGLTGKMKDIAGHDNNVLSLCGNLSYSAINRENLPSVYGAQLADIMAGYIAAFSALGAVFGKRNQESSISFDTIDASMMHSAMFMNQIYIAEMNATKKSPEPEKEMFNGKLPNYRMYKTKDEKGVFFGPIEPNLFANFCNHIGQKELLEIKDKTLLTEKLSEIFSSKKLAEWETELAEVDCCFSQVNSLEEAIEYQQIKELGILSLVDDEEYGNLILANHPASLIKNGERFNLEVLKAPELNEHREELLKNLE